MAPKKVYAVRRGHRTGIFNTWDECQEATTGFSGAQFKSFKSKAEAQAWLAGSSAGAAAPANPAAGGSSSSGAAAAAAAAAGDSGGGKVYAVARGRQVGIFNSWAEAKALIDGFTNPVFKSFKSRQEAAEFLAQQGGSSSSGGGRDYSTVRGAGEEGAGAAAKRQRGARYQAPDPPPAFTAQQQQQPPTTTALLGQHPVVMFTFDGGSRNNPGRAGYGYAVFERQRNERLRMGCRPLPYGSTNNEAEYGGLIAGMRFCLEKLGAKHILARGDSQLVVRQMTGQYGVKGDRLLPLYREAKLLQQRCESFQIEHIYREENSLADLLSNLAMDSDAAADKVVDRWQKGASREELAALLAAAAQVDGDVSAVNALRTAPCFMLAAAQLLGQLWDNMPVEEVTADLATRGWDEGTGGPPVDPLPLPPGVSNSNNNNVTAAGAGAGTSGVVAAAVAAMEGRSSRGQGGGRGMQAVPVAPVTLGQGWAQEISRQEALMQQQQQRGVEGGGGGSVISTLPAQQRTSAAAAAAAAAGVPRLLIGRPASEAAAASLAAARAQGADASLLLQQLQRYRQRRTWPYAHSSSAAASSSMCYSAGACAEPGQPVRSGRARMLLRQVQPAPHQQQHSRSASVLSRVMQQNSSALLRSSSGSLRVRAGRALSAAAVAAAGRLYRREAAAGSGGSDSSRRQRGMRAMAV